MLRRALNVPRLWDCRIEEGNNWTGRLQLWLTMRLGLQPRSPTGPPGTTHLAATRAEVRRGELADLDGNMRRCRSWLRDEWTVYVGAFSSSVQEFWSDRFVVSLNPERLGAGMRPQVAALRRELGLAETSRVEFHCMFEAPTLREASQRQGAHAILEVVHLEEAETRRFRSSMDWQERRGVLSDRDAHETETEELAWSGSGTVVVQRRHLVGAHEVGHLLFLRHPGDPGTGEECNADACYGESPAERDLIMGTGTGVTAAYARPWIRSIGAMSGIVVGWEARVRA